VKVLAVVDAEEKARLAREEASKAARETQAPAPAPSGADVGRGEPMQSRRRCARSESSLGADVGRGEPSPTVPAQMWAGVSPVPEQTWAGVSPVPLSRRRCGRGGPSPGADVRGLQVRRQRADQQRDLDEQRTRMQVPPPRAINSIGAARVGL
jgi:hypothetical protein